MNDPRLTLEHPTCQAGVEKATGQAHLFGLFFRDTKHLIFLACQEESTGSDVIEIYHDDSSYSEEEWGGTMFRFVEYETTMGICR